MKSVAFLSHSDSELEFEIQDGIVIFVGYTHTKEEYERGFYKKKRRKKGSSAKPIKDLEILEDPDSEFVNPTDIGESDAVDEMLDDLQDKTNEKKLEQKEIKPQRKEMKRKTISELKPSKFGSLDRKTPRTKPLKTRTSSKHKSWTDASNPKDIIQNMDVPSIPELYSESGKNSALTSYKKSHENANPPDSNAKNSLSTKTDELSTSGSPRKSAQIKGKPFKNPEVPRTSNRIMSSFSKSGKRNSGNVATKTTVSTPRRSPSPLDKSINKPGVTYNSTNLKPSITPSSRDSSIGHPSSPIIANNSNSNLPRTTESVKRVSSPNSALVNERSVLLPGSPSRSSSPKPSSVRNSYAYPSVLNSSKPVKDNTLPANFKPNKSEKVQRTSSPRPINDNALSNRNSAVPTYGSSQYTSKNDVSNRAKKRISDAPIKLKRTDDLVSIPNINGLQLENRNNTMPLLSEVKFNQPDSDFNSEKSKLLKFTSGPPRDQIVNSPASRSQSPRAKRPETAFLPQVKSEIIKARSSDVFAPSDMPNHAKKAERNTISSAPVKKVRPKSSVISRKTEIDPPPPNTPSGSKQLGSLLSTPKEQKRPKSTILPKSTPKYDKTPPKIPSLDRGYDKQEGKVSMRKIKIQNGEIVEAKVVELPNGKTKVFIPKRSKARAKSMMVDRTSKPVLDNKGNFRSYDDLPPPPPDFEPPVGSLEQKLKNKRKTIVLKIKGLGNMLTKKF
eukprot:NODE_114_length_19305_cov_0.149849.p1 type:complete len:727 gc:universal NODE_114_length_19305_cov_0.149849:16558-18738(+)